MSSSNEEYVIKREIYDSSILSKFISVSSITDVGSGGGIPGMILAILNPNKKVTLIDRKSTFIDFLEIVKSELKLENVVVEKQDFFDNKYEEKVESFGKEITPSLEKSILMQVIDQNWTDHLSQLEDLRQIVGIRGYGQRDPLNEYKSESFLLFET